MDIIALLPYGKHTKSDDVEWHLVIFDKWIKLNRTFPRKWKTYLSIDWEDGVMHFHRDWGKPNSCDAGDHLLKTPEKIPEWAEVDYHKVIRLPWERISYRYYNLKNGKWVLNTGKTYEEQKEQEKDQDVYETTFHFFEDKETGKTSPNKLPGDNVKRIVVKAKITAWRRKYCWRILPKWLPIFPHIVDNIEIDLNEEIGRGRGSWKGGMMGRPYPFTKSLKESWNNFAHLELPKYLKGEK